MADVITRRRPERILLIGSGTSYATCLASCNLYEAVAGPGLPHVAALPAGAFHQYRPALAPQDMVIGLSASGETTDILTAFEGLRSQHCLVSLTGNPDSTLARWSDLTIPCPGTTSRVPSTTKTYSATLSVLCLLWLATVETEAAYSLRGQLSLLPEQSHRLIAVSQPVAEGLAATLAGYTRGFVFGTGPAYALSLEAALKFKEISLLNLEAGEAGELTHGGLSVVDESCLAIGIDLGGRGSIQTRAMARHCGEVGAKVLLVGPGTELGLDSSPALSEFLAPILYALPLYLLAVAIAQAKGLDPDHPHWYQRYLEIARRPPTPGPGEIPPVPPFPKGGQIA